ncbi:hypothetical protein DPMN_011673 [Dreissena polymorpha]|uniref:Uncharacterized protein n=1 Tax=Dreissena polymorpha TaxID=45954 RepID=A0A9D4S226_DREPO|nr:hypothetical protein DPMN_011673 [Dreissena polymorpha]
MPSLVYKPPLPLHSALQCRVHSTATLRPVYVGGVRTPGTSLIGRDNVEQRQRLTLDQPVTIHQEPDTTYTLRQAQATPAQGHG